MKCTFTARNGKKHSEKKNNLIKNGLIDLQNFS